MLNACVLCWTVSIQRDPHPAPPPRLPGIAVLTRWVKKPGFLLIPKIIERRTLKRYICTALYSGIFIIAKTWK